MVTTYWSLDDRVNVNSSALLTVSLSLHRNSVIQLGVMSLLMDYPSQLMCYWHGGEGLILSRPTAAFLVLYMYVYLRLMSIPVG